MIRLNCFVSVKAENREKVLEAARRLTAASLKQEGCIAYDIFESATRPEVLMFCETWRDQAALDAHATSDVFIKETKCIHDLADLKLERLSFDR
ncbi:MAG: antibiotic biosynthesis monooxygenase [Muribaculaceae bacterium]|nr:antibiotic biosynthesis monooxygenase [Muribaculaceae bacterium]